MQSLAQALQLYMRQSEQLETTLVLAADDKVAAGLLIQRLPIEGEGVHVALPAVSPRERLVMDGLIRRHGRASAERLLCGQGLVDACAILCEADGVPGAALPTAAAVTEAALARAASAGRLVELDPGASWAGPDAGSHREWLVMCGSARIGTQWLAERDYHVAPEGSPAQALHSDEGALVFLRESAVPAVEGDAAFSVLDREAGWPDFVPGIQRRVLWHREGQAAMLYFAQAGAQVPLHTHGHDEECLMIEGELFVGDILLCEREFQLAPAGLNHGLVQAATDCLVYVRGDSEMELLPA